VTSWAGATLPKSVGADTVVALLGVCDQNSVAGLRDFAILTVLARLGLRAAEVAALELADIDWHHGEVMVRGKGNRYERLPLPVDVGEAVVAYLARRPRVGCRDVFLRVLAPSGGLTPSGVEDVVRGACKRAGLAPVGAHRLRHHTAAALLAGGASLSEVGQVLRHTHLATTNLYAKLDRATLRTIAQPWPGGEK
jgi:integrase/recombinase XerD